MDFLTTALRKPALGIASALILGAAGAAAIASGIGITGDNPVRVGEPVTFVANSTGVAKVGASTLHTIAVIYNDDISMEVSANTFPGDNYKIVMALTNNSNVDQAQRLTIDAPDGFRFAELTTESATGIIGVGQAGPRSFVYQLDATATAALLELEVKVLPQVVPGFYTLTFTTEALPTTTNFG